MSSPTALDNFRTVVSRTDAWRTITDSWVLNDASNPDSGTDETATTLAASSRVVRFGEDGPAELPRMYVRQESRGYTAVATDTYQEEGSLYARMDLRREQTSGPGYLDSEYTAVQRFVSELADEIAREGFESGLLDVADVTVDQVGLSARNDEVEHWSAVLIISYPSAVG